MKEHFYKVIKRLLHFPLFAPLFGWLLALKTKPLFPSKTGVNIRIAVLNSDRFLQDLKVLSQQTDIEFVEFPIALQHLLNAIGRVHKIPRDEYFLERDERIKKIRKDFVVFLAAVLKFYKRMSGVDGMMTCSFYYFHDQDWDEAAVKAGLPFYAYYKENLKYEVRQQLSISEYVKRNYKFKGSNLLVFDNLSKETLGLSGITHPHRIEVIGIPRFDDLYVHLPELKKKPRQDMITLFSFRHTLAGFLTDRKIYKNGFSLREDEGFVKLFRDVHAIFAKVALRHPNHTFLIKPKWLFDWKEQIEKAIFTATGKTLAEIPNLIIDDKGSAVEIISNSKAIIGFNSTTLLEAKLLNVPTILPFFNEASEKYSDSIYFKKYFDQFYIATSPSMLDELIENAVKGLPALPEMKEEMVQRYLGPFDGKASQRFYEILSQSKQSPA